MAKGLDFKQLEVKGADWYTRDNFTGAEKVSNKPSNPALGIANISLYKPNGDHPKVKASVSVRMENGLVVYGTIFLTDDMEHFRFGVQQRTYKQDGEDKYADINVNVPMPVQAQILRFAETIAIEEAVKKTPAPQAEAVDIKDQLAGMTKEELTAMLEGM